MSLEQKIKGTEALLSEIEKEYAPATFANSYGAEDMVLTDLIAKHFPGIEIFSLDTGRLPEETYRLMKAVTERYAIRAKVYFPESRDVEKYLAQPGPNGFYDSIEQRRECCRSRRVEPLKRALAGKRAWITGLRREQSATRQDVPPREWDGEHGVAKGNP